MVFKLVKPSIVRSIVAGWCNGLFVRKLFGRYNKKQDVLVLLVSWSVWLSVVVRHDRHRVIHDRNTS